jgi:hypothetical protein
MDVQLRIVTRLPLEEVWRDDGFATTSRRRELSKDDITELLRAGLVQFVIADVGAALQWIQLHDCYQFWKDEAKPHLASESAAVLENFPGEYCYFASEWDNGAGLPRIVVLEKAH